MTMMFRTTDDSQHVEVYDETGRIGALYFVEPDEEDAAEGWAVELYGFELGGSRTTALFSTGAEAVDAARPLYDALLEHRRRMARIWGRVSVVSGGLPTLGKRR
jgi:hypothetical protein